jgi:hypothetical protein
MLTRALAIAIACALTSTAANSQPAPGSAGGQRETITGTISRIDSRSGTFDLLTGVGHSVRVRRVRYRAGLKVMAQRAEVGMPALVPGAICRVECEVATSGATATGVQVLYAAPARMR